MMTSPILTTCKPPVDQRRSLRVTFSKGGIPVICQRGSQILFSKANALGERGAFVFSTSPFPVGSIFTLELGFAPKIRVEAKVRCTVSRTGMGVEFFSLQGESRSRLLKWLGSERLRSDAAD